MTNINHTAGAAASADPVTAGEHHPATVAPANDLRLARDP
jgi:hypothetical protein